MKNKHITYDDAPALHFQQNNTPV